MRSLRLRLSFFVAAAAAWSLGGCGGSGSPSVEVTVSPAAPTVLTCTQQTFTAAVTGASDGSVTWSASPGSITSEGVYSAPAQVPATPSATIKATSRAEPDATGSTTVTLATAVVGPQVSLVDEGIADAAIYQHQVATSGDRVYAAYATAASEVLVRRSDDAGKTWSAPVNAAKGIDVKAGCVAVAVDAGSPDVVYLVYTLAGTKIYETVSESTMGNAALVLAVSTDGAATWQSTPLLLGGHDGGPFGGHDAVGICPDVISPAADAVVVESPGMCNGDGNPDMFLFSDAHRGAGFAAGTAADMDYQANGETGALATVARNLGLCVGQNGGMGDVTESPRLFTDKKGKTCLVWEAQDDGQNDGVFVQCSTDLGQTFSEPVTVTKAAASKPYVPAGVLGPNGETAIVWHADADPAGTLLFTTSADGKSFAAPQAIPLPTPPSGTPFAGGDADVAVDGAGVLWVAYHVDDGGSSDRIFVDKSCDFGKTWSGAVLVNGPGGAIANAKLPGLVVTKSAIGVHSFAGTGAQLARLVP